MRRVIDLDAGRIDRGDRRHSPTHTRLTEAALRICWDLCPVRDECRQFAHANREPFGVWGGEATTQRRRNLRHRGERTA
jgi:WhiB family redox-sensing transcriptional regulator